MKKDRFTEPVRYCLSGYRGFSGGKSMRVPHMSVRISANLILPMLLAAAIPAFAQELKIGDQPVLPGHINQVDITNYNKQTNTIIHNKLNFRQIFNAGEFLFEARFNKLDGQGRPAATGAPPPTSRVADQPPFIRTSAPDSNSCAGCHNQPRTGGAGDFVANVFVLAQVLDPVTFSVSSDFSDERNTLGMMGSGPIELLGREMTKDLLSIKAAAIAGATASGQDVTTPLTSKGVSFGSITAHPGGSVDTSQVQGVDADLIIKPFHQKGVVRSVREFTVNAYNHHHGMEAVERFGDDQPCLSCNHTGTHDFDQDGVEDELSIGDITAATIYQAGLNTPGQVLPNNRNIRDAIERGEQRFDAIGCTSCHIPALTLNDATFCEPYDLNPAGTFSDISQSYCFNLTQVGEKPRLEKAPHTQKGAIVRAYTDLKRHQICDANNPHYCNETKIQNGVPTDQFITRKLWDAGNSAPYGHRGDLTTIGDAILAHGGEATDIRNNFFNLSDTEKAEIVEFLKSLQMLPPGSPRIKHVSLNDFSKIFEDSE